MLYPENLECRYCLETDIESNLINPCGCSNPVHKSCLTKWIVEKCRQNRNYLDALNCEICNLTFAPGLIDLQEIIQELKPQEEKIICNLSIFYIFIFALLLSLFIGIIYIIKLLK